MSGEDAQTEPTEYGLWRRICQLATTHPAIEPDMDGDRFARILSREKRPSSLDLALIADAFSTTVDWLLDEDEDLLAGSSLASPQALAIRAHTPAEASDRFMTRLAEQGDCQPTETPRN